MRSYAKTRSVESHRNHATQMAGEVDRRLIVERILRGIAIGSVVAVLATLYVLSWLAYITA